MIALFFQSFRRFVLFILLLAAACSAPMVLVSKSSAVPPGIDLSGMWLLRGDGDTRHPATLSGGQEGIRIPGGSRERSRPPRKSGGATVPVFLEYGTSLKISQTPYGIFISYDRSVVEEFTFGENRTVEIGPIEAQRVSGWEGDSFVIETLDDSGTTLFESWHLDGDVLARNIRIARGETDSFVQTQLFDRQ